MKITLGTDIRCPNCQKKMTVETGFWGMFFFSSLLQSITNRLKEEGGIITCPHCKIVSEIEPETS